MLLSIQSGERVGDGSIFAGPTRDEPVGQNVVCSVMMLGETSGRLELGHSKYGVEGVEREIG